MFFFFNDNSGVIISVQNRFRLILAHDYKPLVMRVSLSNFVGTVWVLVDVLIVRYM